MFEMSENVGKLAEALAKAQGEMKPVVRDKTADIRPKDKASYSYKYADLADVLEACRPQLAKNGIAVVQSPYRGDDGSLGIVTTLAHTSGEWMRGGLAHSMDLKKWQDMGAGLTFLRRYCLSAMAGVASEDDTDAADLKGKRPPRPKREEEPPPEQTTPAKVEEVLEAVNTAATPESVDKTLSVFTSRVQWLHDHHPHFYESIMTAASNRKTDLQNVSQHPMAAG